MTNSTVQSNNPSALIVGINAHIALETARLLLENRLDVLGLTSAWYHNPLFPAMAPPGLQLADQFPAPQTTIDYLIIFGDHPALADYVEHPLAQTAKIFIIIPQDSANTYYQLQPSETEPAKSLNLLAASPFEALINKVKHALHKHHQLLQIIYLRDVLNLLDSQEQITSLQAFFSRLDQNILLLAANQSQQVTPISIEDTTKQLIRIFFSRLRTEHRYTLTGNHQQPLINIAFSLQSIARTKLNRIVDIIPLPGLTLRLPEPTGDVITPKRSQNLEAAMLNVLQESIRRQEIIHQNHLSPIASPRATASPLASSTPPPLLQNQLDNRQVFTTEIEIVDMPPTPPAILATHAPLPAKAVVEPAPLVQPSPPGKVPTLKPLIEPKTITKQPETPPTLWKPSPSPVKKTPSRFSAKPANKQKKSFWRFLFLGVLCLVIIITAIHLAPFIFSYQYYQQSQELSLDQLDEASLQTKLSQAQTSYSMATNNLSLLAQSPLGSLPQTKMLQIKLDLLSHQTQINYQIALAKRAGLQATNIITGQEPGDPYPHLKDTEDRLFLVYNLLTKQLDAAVNLKASNQPLSPEIDQVITNIQTNVPAARKKILTIHQALNLFPQIIKPNQKTDLLVLLQNHLELRPTGGFLEGVGLLSFDSGKFLNHNAHNIYDLDRELKGQVDPPPDLAQLLGEPSWYFRDVNWDPDFPNTAKNAEWFLDKETGQSVAATMSHTSTTIPLLLEVLGDQTTPDGTVITSKNFLDRLNSEPAPQLNNLENQLSLLPQAYTLLVESFASADNQTKLKALDVLLQSFVANQSRLTAHDSDAMRGLVELSWAGDIINPVCPTDLSEQVCIVDYFSLNEANVGVNRANASIERSETHTVNLQAGSVNHSHQLILKNTATSNQWPSGDYKAYLRAYLPANSQLKRVSIDGTTLEPAQVTETVEHGKNIVAFTTTVPVQQSQTLEISYQTPDKFTTDTASAYTILFQKQPGIGANPLTLTIKYPPAMHPTRASHPNESLPGALVVKQLFDKDFFFAVELQP